MAARGLRTLPLVLPLAQSRKRFILQELGKEDVDRAVRFQADIFAKYEPLSSYMNNSTPQLAASMLKAYRETSPSLSVVIKDESDNIAGVGLRDELLIDTSVGLANHPFPRYFTQFFDELEDHYRAYYRANKLTGRVLRFTSTGVDPTCRGLKLAEYIGFGAALIGKRYNYTQCMVESSNLFGNAYLRSLGFKVIKSVRYSDWEYKGNDGPRYPFKTVNEDYTRKVNEKYGWPKYQNLAEVNLLMGTTVDDILNGASHLGL